MREQAKSSTLVGTITNVYLRDVIGFIAALAKSNKNSFF